MKNIFNLDNPVYEFFNKLVYVMIFNFLWVITSIPVITIGASNTALYTVMMRLTAEKPHGLFRLYFQSFKEHFKQATAIWLISIPLTLICIVDIYFFYRMQTSVNYLLCGIVVVVTVIYILIVNTMYLVMIRFGGTLKEILRMTWFVFRTNFVLILAGFFLCAIVFAAMCLILYFHYMLLFFGYGLIVFIASYFYNRVFEPYEEEEE